MVWMMDAISQMTILDMNNTPYTCLGRVFRSQSLWDRLISKYGRADKENSHLASVLVRPWRAIGNLISHSSRVARYVLTALPR
jgi:hypothetical protein